MEGYYWARMILSDFADGNKFSFLNIDIEIYGIIS